MSAVHGPGGPAPSTGLPSISVATNSSIIAGGPAQTPRVERYWFSRSAASVESRAEMG